MPFHSSSFQGVSNDTPKKEAIVPTVFWGRNLPLRDSSTAPLLPGFPQQVSSRQRMTVEFRQLCASSLVRPRKHIVERLAEVAHRTTDTLDIVVSHGRDIITAILNDIISASRVA